MPSYSVHAVMLFSFCLSKSCTYCSQALFVRMCNGLVSGKHVFLVSLLALNNLCFLYYNSPYPYRVCMIPMHHFGNQFYPYTMWIPGIELRLAGCLAIFLACFFRFLRSCRINFKCLHYFIFPTAMLKDFSYPPYTLEFIVCFVEDSHPQQRSEVKSQGIISLLAKYIKYVLQYLLAFCIATFEVCLFTDFTLLMGKFDFGLQLVDLQLDSRC